MDSLNHLGWVVYKSYEIGGYVFGIRTNSELAGAARKCSGSPGTATGGVGRCRKLGGFGEEP